jgi:hypothetical protein
MPDINVEHGFLEGTLVSPKGEVGGANPARDRGVSFARLPTDEEKELFRKFQDPTIGGQWPADLDPDDYAVAAIYVQTSLDTGFDLTIKLDEGDLGTVIRHTNLDFTVVDAYDDPPTVYGTGDADCDGAVNVLDMIQVGQHFGESGAAGWISADVNKDGFINVLDLTLVGQKFD